MSVLAKKSLVLLALAVLAITLCADFWSLEHRIATLEKKCVGLCRHGDPDCKKRCDKSEYCPFDGLTQ